MGDFAVFFVKLWVVMATLMVVAAGASKLPVVGGQWVIKAYYVLAGIFFWVEVIAYFV